jgi:dipeptidyl aminopeptidase/acylaminoacyl peptidase
MISRSRLPRTASVRFIRSAAAAALFATALVPAIGGRAAAQQQRTASVVAQRRDTGAVRDTSRKKILGLADIGRWKRVTNPALSNDGKWAAYVFAPNEGDDTLFVRQLDGSALYTIPVGSALQFSDDARYAGYLVAPATNPNAGKNGNFTASLSGPVKRFELLDLATGEKFEVPNVASFQFSDDSRFVAVRGNRPDGSISRGGDLTLRELASHSTRNIGNVDEYAFGRGGRLLAYTVDAPSKVGSGVYLTDLETNATRALDTAPDEYAQLAWGDADASLAVLRGAKPKGATQRQNVLLVWEHVDASMPTRIEYDPAHDASFPNDMVLSELAPLRWTRDGTRVWVGLKAQERDKPASAERPADVDVWHWNDPDVQSVQVVRLAQERRATMPAAFTIASRRLVQLGDAVMRNVTPTADSRFAIGRVDTSYRTLVQWGGDKADYYRLNAQTGERRLIAPGVTRTLGTSPDGRWFLYLANKKLLAYDLTSARTVTLGGDVKASFVDERDDYPYETPPYGIAGWSSDGKSVVANTRYDLYALPLDGGKSVNLTGGAGAAQQIVFRVARLDRPARARGQAGENGAPGDSLDRGIDLGKPLLLSAFGELTKKSGYFSLAPGGKPAPMIYDDESIGQAIKAAHADRVLFTRQSFSEPADLWASNTRFAAPAKVTDVDPFITEYAWGSRRQIDFKNSKGVRLQGTLTLPANYVPGRTYPMLVYIYERQSDGYHNFPLPIFDDRPHVPEYASRGYLVFQPDIVYETGKPGTSALDCVTSGVKQVIALGYADPKRLGLQGHSWGGYESSFILTHSSLFAAVVTGAPPVDLLSFYGETYPGTGTLQQGIVEKGQVRMGTNPWDDRALFDEQSPITSVRNITAPFLILQGTADNAVDWHQGLELYAAARRWGKKVIFLSYPGEKHHLTRKENQMDFQRRMQQFFDHYLLGTPAPKWMTEGVPQMQKGEPPVY